MTRTRRLTVLARLLSERRFRDQDSLGRALAREGVEVTQATLSRDLRSLGVGKRPGADGEPAYELPSPATEAYDRARQRLDLTAFVNGVEVAQNLVVVRTPPGHANGVGRAIDLLGFDGMLGSVAGDDTLLVVMLDAGRAKKFKKHIDGLATASVNGNGGGKRL